MGRLTQEFGEVFLTFDASGRLSQSLLEPFVIATAEGRLSQVLTEPFVIATAEGRLSQCLIEVFVPFIQPVLSSGSPFQGDTPQGAASVFQGTQRVNQGGTPQGE